MVREGWTRYAKMARHGEGQVFDYLTACGVLIERAQELTVAEFVRIQCIPEFSRIQLLAT